MSAMTVVALPVVVLQALVTPVLVSAYCCERSGSLVVKAKRRRGSSSSKPQISACRRASSVLRLFVLRVMAISLPCRAHHAGEPASSAIPKFPGFGMADGFVLIRRRPRWLYTYLEPQSAVILPIRRRISVGGRRAPI